MTERRFSYEGRNLFDELMALRDRQREQRNSGVLVVRGDDVPWELNRQGKMKWYLHPSIHDTSMQSLLFQVQELPPGGRSGRQHTPGGIVMFVLEGRGYTVLDGERHDWETRTCLGLPLRTDGLIVQHFNADPDKPARFILCQANLVDALTVDKGPGLEQLENAPEADA